MLWVEEVVRQEGVGLAHQEGEDLVRPAGEAGLAVGAVAQGQL